MMRSHFEQLRRRKSFVEQRSLPIRVIALETGISQGAILRVKNLKLARVYLSTLEGLCRYFDVESLSELMEYVRNPDDCRNDVSDGAHALMHGDTTGPRPADNGEDT